MNSYWSNTKIYLSLSNFYSVSYPANHDNHDDSAVTIFIHLVKYLQSIIHAIEIAKSRPISLLSTGFRRIFNFSHFMVDIAVFRTLYKVL